LAKAVKINSDAPVVISKFETGAKEIEMDAVAHRGEILIYAISEHVENAGVHSGDATIVLPPQRLYLETIKQVKKIGKQIAKSLNITGPFNIQFLAKNNQIKVIECNLRASRSFPFVSKVTGYNFMEIATKAILNQVPKKKFITLELDHVGVKAAQFSFSRLKGADPVLGVEMASTGEVGCFGDDLYEAFLKSFLAVGLCLPQKNILVSIGRLEDKVDFLETAQKLMQMKFNLFATENTAKFLNSNGIKATKLFKVRVKNKPNINQYLSQKKLDLVINIPKNYAPAEITDGYLIRRKAVDNNIPLVTNLQLAKLLVQSLGKYSLEDLKIKAWQEYL
jgi:carbamoyl-phosphate synthase large subunit